MGESGVSIELNTKKRETVPENYYGVLNYKISEFVRPNKDLRDFRLRCWRGGLEFMGDLIQKSCQFLRNKKEIKAKKWELDAVNDMLSEWDLRIGMSAPGWKRPKSWP